MRASIVIPTYNASRHLPRQLECLRRTDAALVSEVLICDDGSSENTRAVIEQHAHGLPVIYFEQPRRGFRAAAARNLGISGSTGEVIIFLDQDVLFSPSFVGVHLQYHEATPRPRLVFGFRKRVAGVATTLDPQLETGVIDDHRRDILGPSGEGIAVSPTPWYYAYTCNLSVSAACRDERFDEKFTGWGNEDLEYAYRLWRSGVEIVCAPEALVVHQDEREMRDPYLNESRGSRADFTAAVLNSVRMLNKHQDDALLVSKLRADLLGFSIVGDQCVRDPAGRDIDEIVRWGLAQSVTDR